MGEETQSLSTPAVASLDLAPLSAKVARKDITAFKRDRSNAWMVRADDIIKGNARNQMFITVIALLAIAELAVIGIVVNTPANEQGLGPYFVVLVGALLVATVVLAVVTSSTGSRAAHWLRMQRFAAANELAYATHVVRPGIAGLLFHRGGDRVAYDVIGLWDPQPVELGNYRYTGELEIGRPKTWGFIRIQLDRRLPHMVLESAGRRRLLGSAFPALTGHRTLALEGDFNRHFVLHVPQDYERDALYVLTPDLMALLIDEAGDFDVEIVDDSMFIYSHRGFRMDSPETFALLDRILATVGAKARRQSARYWDDRQFDRAANTVARSGRRLRQGRNRFYIVGGVLIVVVIVATLVAAALMHHG